MLEGKTLWADFRSPAQLRFEVVPSLNEHLGGDFRRIVNIVDMALDLYRDGR